MDERYIFEGTVVIGNLRGGEYVLLEPLTRDESRYPTIHLGIEMAAAGLKGVDPDEEIGIYRLEEFLQEFTDFEERRSGSVTLKVLGDEFSLTFEVVHVAGDVEVQADLKHFSWGAIGFIPCEMRLRFEIDPTSLPGIRDQFREMLAWQAPNSSASKTP